MHNLDYLDNLKLGMESRSVQNLHYFKVSHEATFIDRLLDGLGELLFLVFLLLIGKERTTRALGLDGLSWSFLIV